MQHPVCTHGAHVHGEQVVAVRAEAEPVYMVRGDAAARAQGAGLQQEQGAGRDDTDAAGDAR